MRLANQAAAVEVVKKMTRVQWYHIANTLEFQFRIMGCEEGAGERARESGGTVQGVVLDDSLYSY